ncbi:MAG TPA: hypothetical protein VG709_07195, partial [Actinomycetota bacterium]|nr:hypothetical protein [Actinomycetota bacterium]
SYIDEVAGMRSNGGNGGGRGGAAGGGTGAPGETGPTAAGRPGAPQRDEPGFGMGYPPRPGEAEGGTSGQRPEEPGG